MRALKALIAEDEPALCDMLARISPELVVTAQPQSLIRRSIKKLIDELNPQLSWQIHRGTVVNVNAIAGVTRDKDRHLRVKLKARKETLAVGEFYRHLFNQV